MRDGHRHPDGMYVDQVVYGLLEHEWPPRDLRGRRLRSVRHPGAGVLEEGLLPERARDGGRARRRPRPVRGGMDRHRARTPDRRVRDGRGQRAPHLHVARRRPGRRRAGRGARASPRPVPDVVLPAPRRARDADGAEGARLSDRADQHVRAGRARDVAHVGARAVRRRRGLLQRDRVCASRTPRSIGARPTGSGSTRRRACTAATARTASWPARRRWG